MGNYFLYLKQWNWLRLPLCRTCKENHPIRYKSINQNLDFAIVYVIVVLLPSYFGMDFLKYINSIVLNILPLYHNDFVQHKTFLHCLNIWPSLDPCQGIWQLLWKGNPFTSLFSPRFCFFPSFFFCSCESFFHFGHIGFRSGHPSSNLFSYPSSYSSGYVSTYPYGYLSSFPSNFGLVDSPVFRPLYYTIFHLIFFYFCVFPWIQIQMGLSFPAWHSSFINCFDGSLECKFIWTLFYHLIPFSCYLLLTYYYSTLKICPKLLWQAPIHI